MNLADRWPNAALRLESIKASGSRTLRGQKLMDAAVAAWAEAFGTAAPTPEELAAQREAMLAESIRERDELMGKIRSDGVDVWNSMDHRVRDRFDLRGIDLSRAELHKLGMSRRDLKNANFAGSKLLLGEMWSGQFQNANFSKADLTRCDLRNSNLEGANFTDADLSAANLCDTRLSGTNFTGATLKDTMLEKAQFDATTVFPIGFTPPDEMVWKGEGPRPGTKKVRAAKAGSLDFETFIAKLGNKVEAARMDKAGSMLKAERFQLFAEVIDNSITGIVKSQSSRDLVYSCRLSSDGGFSCCTQNLRPCGGLRGALCKHLLVLIVGLAKAGELDSATVDHWIDLSRVKKPAIDEDAMSATFLKFKGAEAGEVDWRPTETIPEDFYAM